MSQMNWASNRWTRRQILLLVLGLVVLGLLVIVYDIWDMETAMLVGLALVILVLASVFPGTVAAVPIFVAFVTVLAWYIVPWGEVSHKLGHYVYDPVYCLFTLCTTGEQEKMRRKRNMEYAVAQKEKEADREKPAPQMQAKVVEKSATSPVASNPASSFNVALGIPPVAPTAPQLAQKPATVTPVADVKAKKAKEKAKKSAGSKLAVAYLPMAKKGEIPTPTVLAQRVRESFTAKADGSAVVKGANITALGFLQAVRAAGGQVDGVQALPKYLTSLVACAMPKEPVAMSRVKYTRHPDGKETYELEIDKGYARAGNPGETGWCDANTGRLILAGNCLNSPIAPYTPKAPATPAARPPAEKPVAKPPVTPPQAAPAPTPEVPKVPLMPLDDLPRIYCPPNQTTKGGAPCK